MALLLTVGCSLEGPGLEGEPPDDVYDPDDEVAEVAEYTQNVNFEKNDVLATEELTDWTAMSVSDVQAFLDVTPYGWKSVLANHSDGGVSAAESIVSAAEAHQINPLVILTRVQLEQSLIGKQSASSFALNYAMGCGCPDGGNCSSAYKGFNKQIDCMASKFREYLEDQAAGGTTIAGWGVGKTKTTLDGYSVTPENEATAAIYTYTPWASAAKNHRKIWVKYANYIDYQEPTSGSGSGSGAGGSGSGAGGSGSGAGGSGSGAGGSGGSGGSVGSGGSGSGGNQVCYLGPNGDNSVCLPLVPHSSSWGSAYDYPSHSSSAYLAPTMFIDLSVTDTEQKLAPNFKVGELMQEYKGRYAMYQPHVVEKIQSIRDQTGGALNVNSGYRSVGYNAGVGGATYSRHMYGDAVDMASSVVSLNTLKTRCQNLGADYIGMYSSHVHCDWRNSNEKDPAFTGNLYFQEGDDHHHDQFPVHTGEIVFSGNILYADATGFDEGEPLREWVALDADGVELERYIGETYDPPFGADSILVEVGGQITLEAQL